MSNEECGRFAGCSRREEVPLTNGRKSNVELFVLRTMNNAKLRMRRSQADTGYCGYTSKNGED
jgi:hypothetical protein